MDGLWVRVPGTNLLVLTVFREIYIYIRKNYTYIMCVCVCNIMNMVFLEKRKKLNNNKKSGGSVWCVCIFTIEIKSERKVILSYKLAKFCFASIVWHRNIILVKIWEKQQHIFSLQLKLFFKTEGGILIDLKSVTTIFDVPGSNISCYIPSIWLSLCLYVYGFYRVIYSVLCKARHTRKSAEETKKKKQQKINMLK